MKTRILTTLALASLALTLSFSSMTFVGCNKETPTVSQPKDPKPSLNEISEWASLCDAPNSVNEFDYVGSEHNRLLEIYEESKESDMALDEVYALTDEILHAELDLDPAYTTEGAVNPYIEDISTVSGLRDIVRGLSITDLQKAKLNSLASIMLEYDGTNLCETIESIKDFENALIEAYDTEDIGAVLCASAVGRYSLAYWDNKAREGVDGGIAIPAGWWKRFLGIALADAVGAAMGSLAGGVGSVALGVGFSIAAAQ